MRFSALSAIALTATLVVGCSSSTPRTEYPRYYDGWSHLSEAEQRHLDNARVQAADEIAETDHLVQYARVATLLARREADRWFEVHVRTSRDGQAQQRRVTRSRARVLESCHHAIALYRELEFKDGECELHDRLNLVWLHAFSDQEPRAEALLDALESEPDLPHSMVPVLDKLRGCLRQESEGVRGSQ